MFRGKQHGFGYLWAIIVSPPQYFPQILKADVDYIAFIQGSSIVQYTDGLLFATQ